MEAKVGQRSRVEKVLMLLKFVIGRESQDCHGKQRKQKQGARMITQARNQMIQRPSSLEKCIILGKAEGKRRRGSQEQGGWFQL